MHRLWAMLSFSVLLALVIGAPGAEARKVLEPSAASTLQRTSTVVVIGALQDQEVPATTGSISGVSVGADGTLSAPASSVTLFSDFCIPRATTSFTGGSFDFGYSNMAPCFPGAKAHWVTDQPLTGNVNPFTGAMSLHLVGHIQLSFKAKETYTGIGTTEYTLAGDGCTVGYPASSPGNQLDLNLSTAGSYQSLSGSPYSELDGTAKLVDGTFAAGPVNCAFGSSQLTTWVLGRLGVPRSAGQSGVSVGVDLDPIARRGVIAALSASPAGPGQAALDASATQVPGGAASWSFDLDGDSTYETAAGGPTMTAPLAPGPHTVGVRVADVDGDADTAQASVTVESPVTTTPITTTPKKKCKKGRKLVKRKGKLRCVKKKK